MMTPVCTITPPFWMKGDAVCAVMAALAAEGESPCALFVGGCVRNSLLKEPVSDIDIATICTPEEVTVRLKKAGIKVIPTGIDHGTVTAVMGKEPFEITTLRKDVETFGRHAVVAFTKDWRKDAQRRDFTMNTLLADQEGHIFDPTGQGLADLEARRVRFVGDPAIRIAEDYLRILRFFRFHAFYGEGAPDEVALAACREAADRIGALSRERVTQEFLKILSVDDPYSILGVMFENNILHDIVSVKHENELLRKLCAFQKCYAAFSVVARLIVLSGFSAAHMAALEKYLILSNAQKKEFKTLLEMLNSSEKTEVFLYRYGGDLTTQALLLRAVRGGDESGLAEAMSVVKDGIVPAFPLSGTDVIGAGVSQGPQVGKILSAIEKWWIDAGFQPDRAACLLELQRLTGR